MLDLLRQYMPHAHCWAGDAGWILATVIGHGITALAYLVISSIAFVAARSASGVARVTIAGVGAFVLACGVGHGLAIGDMYRGLYRVSTAWLSLTALISAATAGWCYLLWARLQSRARALKSLSGMLALPLSGVPTLIDLLGEARTLPDVLQSLLDDDPETLAIVGSIKTTGPRAGHLFAVSTALAEALGYEPHELRGRSLFDLIVDEDREASEAAADVDTLAAAEVDGYVNRWAHRDGSGVPFRWTAIYHEEGNPIGAWRAERV